MEICIFIYLSISLPTYIYIYIYIFIYILITENISSRKCKNENVRENYGSVGRRWKEVHKSIQMKDER